MATVFSLMTGTGATAATASETRSARPLVVLTCPDEALVANLCTQLIQAIAETGPAFTFRKVSAGQTVDLMPDGVGVELVVTEGADAPARVSLSWRTAEASAQDGKEFDVTPGLSAEALMTLAREMVRSDPGLVARLGAGTKQ